jgi:hypothetical protein
MQVKGEKNSGNWNRVKDMFKDAGGNDDNGSKIVIANGFLLTLLFCLYCIVL